MKKTFILLGFLFMMIDCFSQSMTARFQGKIKAGSAANSVMIVVKSNETFTGQWTNVQFVLQVPNTISPQPGLSIKTNPLSANIATASYIQLNSNEGGFYNYLFSATTASSPAYNFTNGTEINVLEVQFTGTAPSVTSEVRMAQLANGGASTQMNFYTEISGNDNTNTTAMFFGAGSSNNAAGYSAYSYTPLSGIVLPVTWGNINLGCTNKGAKLNWQTYTEAGTGRFEIEKAITGAGWNKIGSISAAGSSSDIKQYEFIDATAGDAAYRLKLVDKDGKYSYSAAVNGNCTTRQQQLSVYPVPAKNSVTVSLVADKAETITIKLVDMLGKVHVQQPGNVVQGDNLININTSALSAGTYYLQVFRGDNVEVSKVIISR